MAHSDENYVTTAELARMMGVCERTIRKFRAEGMPYETWGCERSGSSLQRRWRGRRIGRSRSVTNN
jgi:phage terminase Nu1 subunit (DNA packaging protein)